MSENDFAVNVRKRFEGLQADRLSACRMEKLRADNPERALMFYLLIGMKVCQLEGFSRRCAARRPSDDGLFDMLLTDHIIYIELAIIFGLAGIPAAFQSSRGRSSRSCVTHYRVIHSCTLMS